VKEEERGERMEKNRRVVARGKGKGTPLLMDSTDDEGAEKKQ